MRRATISCIAAALVILGAGLGTTYAGRVFVTGHDADYHATHGDADGDGAKNIIRRAIEFVTGNNPTPNLLFVTSRINPGGDNVDSVLGMNAAGYFGFDIADDGTAGGAILDLNDVDFELYDAIIVASDYGGWLRQGELDILIARSLELIHYLNDHDGGLIAFSEAGNRPSGYPGCSSGFFGFLPFLVSSAAETQVETSYTLTAYGASLGLLQSDVEGNFSHCFFEETGGMEVVDLDSQDRIITLAWDGLIDLGGVDPDPPSVVCPDDIVVSNDPGFCSAIVEFEVEVIDEAPGYTIECDPPSGSVFPKGTTTVTCTVTDALGNHTASCSFTVTVLDTEAPVAECAPTTNPSGKNVPQAGENPKSGQNPDGFYMLLGTDNCDSPSIFVKDSASDFIAGPFQNGDRVKITQVPGGKPGQKPMAGVVVSQIKLKGDALVFAVDSSGNVSEVHTCYVPPKPK